MNRYGAPSTYKHIVPDRGCGFILKRIYELTEDPKLPRGTHVKNPTKQDVYVGTNWANRPGWSSLLWSSLIKDGLIESDDGLQKVKLPRSYWHARRDSNVSYRAAGHCERGVGYTVRYHLTPKGRGILFDMMNRVGAKGKTLNSVGSVAEHDAKKDERAVEATRHANLTDGLNERLKKIRERLIAIGNETDLLQAEIQQLIARSSKQNNN